MLAFLGAFWLWLGTPKRPLPVLPQTMSISWMFYTSNGGDFLVNVSHSISGHMRDILHGKEVGMRYTFENMDKMSLKSSHLTYQSLSDVA